MIIREGMGKKTRNLVYPSEATGYYTISTGKPYSEKTAELIDEEVAEFTTEAAKRAEAVQKANRKVLDRVASALLEKESLEEEDLKNIFDGATLPDAAKLHD